MIEVDISGVWGAMTLPDLLGAEARIHGAHRKLLDETGSFRIELPGEETLPAIETAAEKIRRESDILVVLGRGPECRCARGTLELLQGQNRNEGRAKGDPGILFAGEDFSSRRWSGVLKSLEGKDFSLCLLPGEKESPETLVALRSLKWNLERRYGTDGAKARIYAPEGAGVLGRMCREEGWTCIDGPSEGLFAPGMLLVLAAAGLNVKELLSGAREMLCQCSLLSYENPLWLYVGVREGMLGRGKRMELLHCQEPDFRELGIWWQLLTAREDPRGPFPVSSVNSLPVNGREELYETLVFFAPPQKQYFVLSDARNGDGLNDLVGRSLEQLQELRRRTHVEAGEESGLGIVLVGFEELTEKTLGEVLCFFHLSAALSGELRQRQET